MYYLDSVQKKLIRSRNIAGKGMNEGNIVINISFLILFGLISRIISLMRR